METHDEAYKGRRIRILEPPGAFAVLEAGATTPPPRLWIDDVPVKVRRLSGGTYISESYAYEAMPTLLALAQRLIDLRESDDDTAAE